MGLILSKEEIEKSERIVGVRIKQWQAQLVKWKELIHQMGKYRTFDGHRYTTKIGKLRKLVIEAEACMYEKRKCYVEYHPEVIDEIFNKLTETNLREECDPFLSDIPPGYILMKIEKPETTTEGEEGEKN